MWEITEDLTYAVIWWTCYRYTTG